MATTTRKPPARARKGSVVSVAQERGDPVAPLPHEIDQALGSAGRAPRRSMKQAHDDLARGLEDTDKSSVMDATYRRLKQKK
jgi:hypothetical protein